MFPDTLTEKLHDIAIGQVNSLTTDERATLFFSYAKKAQTVWLAKGENGFLMIESQDAVLLPVFPHKDLVPLWTVASEVTCTPEAVSLAEFTDVWLPGLTKNETGICVFPLNDEDAGLAMSAEECAQNFAEEGN